MDEEPKAIEPFVGTDGVKEEVDEELKAVQPFVRTGGARSKPLWMSYLDWLNLMVAHVNAAMEFVAYVTWPRFQHQTVSMKIIDAPCVDQGLLPWRELFIDSTVFPTETERDSFFAQGNGRITNTGIRILEFLNKAVESSSEANAAKKLWDKKDIGRTITSLEKIRDSNFLGWGKCAKEQLVKLRELDGPPNDALSCEISEAIGSLCDSAKFFDFLGQVRSFSGTMHCEACLASLLDETKTPGESPLGPLAQMEVRHDSDWFSPLKISFLVKDFGPIIGISERSCCPTCQHLLSLLSKQRDRPLIVTGSHNALTPCTMPTWLPGHIVDSMNQFFGAQLRRELVEIVDRSEILQNPSTDLDWPDGGLDHFDPASLLGPDCC